MFDAVFDRWDLLFSRDRLEVYLTPDSPPEHSKVIVQVIVNEPDVME
jgi:hypothetical protein